MRIKLLQCGDLHLDAPFTSLSDMEDKPEQRRAELRQVLSGIVDTAAAAKAELLLVCGDLYEHGYIRKSTIHYICDQFGRIPDISVIIIPGNHDPVVSGSYYSDFVWPSNVHILTDGIHYFEHPDGVRVYGGLPAEGMPDRSYINILMYHGTLDMMFSKDAYRPVSSAELDAYGFDYCALGHFHSTIRGAGSGKNIFNAGSPEPLGFDEEGGHGVFVSVVGRGSDDERYVQADFIKLNRRSFINASVNIAGCLSNEQAAGLTAACMEAAGCSEDLYRISLTGYIPREFRVNTGAITEILAGKAFYIRLADRTTPDYDFERLAEEPGLRGIFVRKMLDRALEAADEDERNLVMQALYYGMEAIEEGRICV